MSDITREQFASAVAAAISSVHHVYRALDRLMLELRQSLAEPPTPLAHMPGTGGGKSGRDPGRLVLRHEYGTLFKGGLGDEDDVEEDEDEEEDEEELEHEGEDDEAEHPKRKRGSPSIAADKPLMALRIAMYDPHTQEAFEPHIAYAVMADWAIKGLKTEPGQQFGLPRYMLRRIPRALATADRKKGAQVVTPAKVKRLPRAKKSQGNDGRLTCRLPMGVEIVPLYNLEEPAAVFELADGMKKMWVEAIGNSRANR